MNARDIIVIGCSAGGVEALISLVAGLPQNLAASVFVVLHLPSGSKSALPRILSDSGPLRATHARNGEEFQHGHIYVAPADAHLLVRETTIELDSGPRQNGHRPAIDPLFRTAAREHGSRVIAVVLSGTRDDGAAGLIVVRACGGMALVQEPRDALFPDMPRNAIELAGADRILPIAAIPDAAVELVEHPSSDRPDRRTRRFVIPALDGDDVGHTGRREAEARAVFLCPECRGPLVEIGEASMMRFQCRTGHVYSPQSLLGTQGEALESALWAALNALEERSTLSRRMATRARERSHEATAKRFEQEAEDNELRAQSIRAILQAGLAVTRGGDRTGTKSKRKSAKPKTARRPLQRARGRVKSKA